MNCRKTRAKRPACCCTAAARPGSSYVLEYLSPHFSITAHYYNPNIDTPEEYAHRARELSRFVPGDASARRGGCFGGALHARGIYAAVKGLEDIPEGGRRCYECYRLRLRRAAQAAAAGGYDYFTTTLSISPHKNAVWLGELGEAFAAEYGVRWLPSDFKKKNGFKRSTELAARYGLYRQDYCGCVFSRREAEARAARKSAQNKHGA